MMKRTLEGLRQHRVARFLGKIREAPPKVRASLVIAGLMIAAYGVSKTRELTVREVAGGKPAGEFHGERIFGSSVAALYREKDGALSKATREYADGVKVLKDTVDELSKRLERLETTKPAATTANTAAAPINGQLPPSVGQRGTESGPTPQGQATTGTETPISNGAPVDQPAGQPVRGYQYPSGGGGAAMSGRGLPSALRLGQPGNAPSRGPATLSFPVKSEESPSMGITLPAGSYVRGKMLTGVAAPEGRPYPVLLQLDYAHVLPNRKRLDLAGCFMIAKAQGDLSTERLQMQATKMSCVGRDGRMFERDITGFVADDKDNNFAVAGEVVAKQDRVAAMAFLSSVVEGIGKAIQQAQTTQQTTPLGGSQSVLTGDEQKYIAAGGASNAAGMVSQWYLKQAQSLLPTINVNSGQDVWIVMQEGVSLPKQYFKRSEKGGNLEDSYSYISRLVE